MTVGSTSTYGCGIGPCSEAMHAQQSKLDVRRNILLKRVLTSVIRPVKLCLI
jgi:hypothetical protein